MKKTHKRLISLFVMAVMSFNMFMPVFAEGVSPTEYTKQVAVETTAGKEEQVTVNVSETRTETDGVTVTESTASATNVITAGGMTVNYDETSKMSGKAGEVPTGTASSHYTSESANGLYIAEGGSESIVKKVLPGASVEIPLTSDKENDKNKRTAESSIAKDPDVEDPYKLLLDDTKIYVVSPASDKIVKIGVFGGVLSSTIDAKTTANKTQSQTIEKSWEVAVATNSVAGVVKSFN